MERGVWTKPGDRGADDKQTDQAMRHLMIKSGRAGLDPQLSRVQ